MSLTPHAAVKAELFRQHDEALRSARLCLDFLLVALRKAGDDTSASFAALVRREVSDAIAKANERLAEADAEQCRSANPSDIQKLLREVSGGRR